MEKNSNTEEEGSLTRWWARLCDVFCLLCVYMHEKWINGGLLGFSPAEVSVFV